MSRRSEYLPLLVVPFLALSARAQTGSVPGTLYFSFPNGTTYTGTMPVSVELWIGVSQPAGVWTNYIGDIVTSDTSSMWPALGSPFANQPGVSLGVPSNGGVSDIILAQLHFPGGGIFGSTENPLLIWTGEWSTPNLTPRTVDVGTITDFALVASPPSNLSYIAFPEASAQIQVIPAPPALTFFAFVGGLVCRRRRERA